MSQIFLFLGAMPLSIFIIREHPTAPSPPIWAIFQSISHIHVPYAVYHDSLWDRQDINPDAVAFAAAIIPGGMHGNPDVREFQSAGGKLMMYYGTP